MRKEHVNLYIYASIVEVILLLVATTEMPSGYYTFLRITAFFSAAAFFWQYFKHLNKINVFLALLFAYIAAVYNPFIPVMLYKSQWCYVNIVCAIIFAGNIYFLREQHK